MSNAAWPVGLPAFVTEDNYSESAANLVIESTVDQGAPKVRRRYTAKYIQMTLTIWVDGPGRALFEDFYYNTLSCVLPFDWVHPMKQTACTMRFRSPPPTFTPFGGTNCKITFNVFILPGSN